MSAAELLASIDGEIMPVSEATIPVTDEGLIRGDGAFEVIRVFDGVPLAMDEHLARMERSARRLRLPVDLEQVRAEAYRLLAEAGRGPAYDAVRVLVTRGGRRVMLTEAMKPLPAALRLASITYTPTVVLDGVKSLSYAANMLARRLAQEAGADDALLVKPDGIVLEAPTASVFWVEDEVLLTPPLSEPILASITRAIILEVTPVQEREVSLKALRDADEIFISSTNREVHPVCALDGVELAAPGPVSARVAEAVERHIAGLLATRA